MDFSNFEIKDLACFICKVLKEYGIEAVLVGGACVSIYSQNRYQSYDLDFATYEDLKKIEKILIKYHFKRRGRYFTHESSPYFIDFVNPPIAIGKELIRSFDTLETSLGFLQLLTPTDCVKDRLSAFFYWNDEQAMEQALLVAKNHNINIRNINRWAKNEGFSEKMNLFLKKLKDRS